MHTPKITDIQKLAEILHLEACQLKQEITNFAEYPLMVPLSFVERMQCANINDPLLWQVLPRQIEQTIVDDYTTDPLLEVVSTPLTGLLHKYYGRVLLLCSATCALNCRFCFRRHHRDIVEDWPKVYDYIASDQSIHEVILSGGDPLMLPEQQLRDIVLNIEAMPHVQTIRIHTRIPIVSPTMITDSLADIFAHIRLQVVFVVHCNHANEVDANVATAVKKLQQRGVIIFNQTVLLKYVNDSAEVIQQLIEKLFSLGVLPYYLHLLDKVAGAAHFFVETSKAKTIFAELQRGLPGYLVPKLVYESSGEPNKMWVT